MKRNNENQAQRLARKVADIKAMFYFRMAEENRKPLSERLKTMDLYEEVAYRFYIFYHHPLLPDLRTGALPHRT